MKSTYPDKYYLRDFCPSRTEMNGQCGGMNGPTQSEVQSFLKMDTSKVITISYTMVQVNTSF